MFLIACIVPVKGEQNMTVAELRRFPRLVNFYLPYSFSHHSLHVPSWLHIFSVTFTDLPVLPFLKP